MFTTIHKHQISWGNKKRKDFFKCERLQYTCLFFEAFLKSDRTNASLLCSLTSPLYIRIILVLEFVPLMAFSTRMWALDSQNFDFLHLWLFGSLIVILIHWVNITQWVYMCVGGGVWGCGCIHTHHYVCVHTHISLVTSLPMVG